MGIVGHRNLRTHAGLCRDFSGLENGDIVVFKTLQAGGTAHNFIRIQSDYAKADLGARGLDFELDHVQEGNLLIWTYTIILCRE